MPASGPGQALSQHPLAQRSGPVVGKCRERVAGGRSAALSASLILPHLRVMVSFMASQFAKNRENRLLKDIIEILQYYFVKM